VENRCALLVKLVENHRKTPGQFLVNRGMMRVKLAENCKRMRGLSIHNPETIRPVVFWRTFPFSLCKMIIFFVRMFKWSPVCCLKKFEG
jgi:hypothetical protein